MKKMLAVCAALVLSAQVFAQEQSEDKKFGSRVFFNASNLANGIASANNITYGFGFGFGVVSLVPFRGIYLASEFSFEQRKFHSEELTYKEWGMKTDFNFRFRYAPENIVYLEIGPAFNVVFAPEVGIEGVSVEFDNVRSSFDIGLNCGIGFRISDHHSLDYKVFRGFTDTNYGNARWSLVTSQIGYTYMF